MQSSCFCRKCGLPWRLPRDCRCGASGGRGKKSVFCEHCGAPLSPGHSCDGPPASYDAFIEMEGVKIAKGVVEHLTRYLQRHEGLGTRGLVLRHWQNDQWTALRRL